MPYIHENMAYGFPYVFREQIFLNRVADTWKKSFSDFLKVNHFWRVLAQKVDSRYRKFAKS